MFGFSKTFGGIDIGARMLRAVKVRRDAGRKAVMERHAGNSLPEGVLIPSYTKENIVDMKRFNELLMPTLEAAGISKGDISASIPDQVVKVSFIDLKDVPKKREDIHNFLKWKAKKLLPYDPEDAKIDFQQFGGKAMTVFIKRDIVRSYEDALLSLSLKPRFVSAPSLNLFNLFSPAFGELKEFAFISALEDSFAVIIMKEGMIDFHRSMDVGFADERFMHEVNSSILFYASENPGVVLKNGFLYAGLQDSEILAASLYESTGVEFKAMRVTDMVEGPKGLDIEPYGPAVAAALYGL